ncbi:MAG: Na+/H+ antiporter NhaA [Planctomycetes bacterium]|nr:Na+/H+ antiporter NhaA [Planctomycetota bacterium]
MKRVIDRAAKPLQQFLRLESAGGLVLVGAAVLALIVANSPLAGRYAALLDLPVVVTAGGFGVAKPLLLWINDGLMAVFFLLVGLELKREVCVGHLSALRRAVLPAAAATGGMAFPAAVFLAFNWGDAAAMRGWAIPAATDIAFSLGVLSLLGSRVPAALKVFLLSVAIFDDLGAIVVIAVFYGAEMSAAALWTAAALVCVLAALNACGVRRLAAYILVGNLLWVAVVKSGVHATLAGVVLAAAIPLPEGARRARNGDEGAAPPHPLEAALHPWVAFCVLPAFAFANAGISLAGLSPADLLHPVPLGVMAGLFAGKQAGIMTACWLAVKSGLADLGEGMRWRELYGVSVLCGIGFTMSYFIASLAFEQGGGAYFGLERLGILCASLLAGVAGYAVLRGVLGSAAGTAAGARLDQAE